MFAGPDGLKKPRVKRKKQPTQGGDMQRPMWRLFIGFVLVCCLAKGSFAQQAVHVAAGSREVCGEQSDAARSTDGYRGVQGTGNHRVSAPEPDLHGVCGSTPPIQVVRRVSRPAGGSLGKLFIRADEQAGPEARSGAEGNGSRHLATGGPGKKPPLRPAERIHTGTPAKGSSGPGSGEPRLLRPRA